VLYESSENPRKGTREPDDRPLQAEELVPDLRRGEVDAFVTSGASGDRVFTLKGEDEPYQLMIQEIAEGAVTLTPHGVIMFSNKRFAAIVKTPLERVIGSAIHSFIASEDVDLFAALLSSSAEGRSEGEVRLKAGLGAVLERSLPVYLSLVRLRTDRLDCVYALITDLREPKWNAEMVASERLHRSILEGAPLLVVDPNGRIVRASRTADQLTGVQVLHKDFDELFHFRVPGSTIYSFKHLFSEALEAHSIKTVEATAVTANGCVDLLLGAVPLQDGASRPIGCIVSLTNITERKAIEERFRETQNLESVRLLAGGIAHNFNNLLVSVIGNASLAQEMLPDGSGAAQFLGDIVRAGDRAAHLTAQLLAYAGNGRMVVEPIGLSEMVREVGEILRPTIPNNISLGLDVRPDLPPIEADRGELQHVIMNLALNALEAIGDDSGQISVRTGVLEIDARSIRRGSSGVAMLPGKYVTLEVRDTGCGMDENIKARIFDPFFTTKFLGRGLGLAAVGGIVRAQNGAITVDSTPGKGTCVTVLLPASDRPAAVSAANALPRRELHWTGAILVVDDEEVVREVARKSLQRYGFTVLLADSGRAAIDIFQRETREISLVLLDLCMPGMSGGETLTELKRIRPDVKVIVSSGYSEHEAMKSFTASQVSGFIQKPYSSARLAEKVKTAVA